MDKSSAKSAAKALYLQSAALAGLEVAPFSAERIADLVEMGFEKVGDNRRPEAAANLLRIIEEVLRTAQEKNVSILHEEDVDNCKERLCPIYPFDSFYGRS